MTLDSMYLELQYVDYEKKFHEFVAACGLDKNIADILIGNKEGKYIFVNKNSTMPFAETNKGILIEIGKDLPEWQEALKKYFVDHPLIKKGRILTRIGAEKELKNIVEEIHALG